MLIFANRSRFIISLNLIYPYKFKGNKSIEHPIKQQQQQQKQQQQSSVPSPSDTSKNASKSPSPLSTNYKYTPLRQSWSNLTQMNTLSPSSLTPRSYLNANEAVATNNKLDEILLEESDRESNHSYLSPKRPQTADSVYGRQYRLHIDQNNPRTETTASARDENSQSEEIDADSDLKTNFYKKYRTQNIRQKKTTAARGHHLSTDLLNARPHSASNLRATNFKLSSNSSSNLLSSASNSDLNTNPIGELYELSKNYQSIDKLQQPQPQPGNKGSGSVYSSMSSSSSSRLSTNNLANYEEELIAAAAQAASGYHHSHQQQTNVSFSIYKSLQTKQQQQHQPGGYESTSSDYDIENETPIKLDCSRKEAPVSGSRKTAQPILRTATSVINGNNLTNVTASSSMGVAFSHSMLPRSRSGSRSHTPTDLIVTRKSGSGHHGNVENSSAGLSSPRSKVTSQYIPLSSSISTVASMAKSQMLQKKKAFY